jgi:hypothetical protein
MQPDDPQPPSKSPGDEDRPDYLPDVTQAQMLEVRAKRIDWFFYCLWRQTCSHDEVMALLVDAPPHDDPDSARN